jgi:hypothetical protein
MQMRNSLLFLPKANPEFVLDAKVAKSMPPFEANNPSAAGSAAAAARKREQLKMNSV